MRRTRIILIISAILLIAALYFLPKAVVENESQLKDDSSGHSEKEATANPHAPTTPAVRNNINRLRARYLSPGAEQKSAIFADSLAGLYRKAGLFDSAAWFAGQAYTFFKTDESLLKAGDASYEAYTYAVDRDKQNTHGENTRELLGKYLDKHPDNLEVKSKMAMTWLSSGSPMKGIALLREVLAADPKNESALFNMGMLSLQSGQNEKAAEWLEKLVAVNEKHIQGQLLLGVAQMNLGETEKARKQFEKVKQLDPDPSVQAAADSYLKELK